MIYPLLSLYDGTEITFTDLQNDGNIIVYVETPNAIDGFHSLECVLPNFEIKNVQGYSALKQNKILEIIKDNVDRIMDQCFSFKEYYLLMNEIKELTKKVKFYEDVTTDFMEAYKEEMRDTAGRDKPNYSGLSEDDEAWAQRIIKGKRIKGKLIDLRKKPPED